MFVTAETTREIPASELYLHEHGEISRPEQDVYKWVK